MLHTNSYFKKKQKTQINQYIINRLLLTNIKILKNK